MPVPDSLDSAVKIPRIGLMEISHWQKKREMLIKIVMLDHWATEEQKE